MLSFRFCMRTLSCALDRLSSSSSSESAVSSDSYSKPSSDAGFSMRFPDLDLTLFLRRIWQKVQIHAPSGSEPSGGLWQAMW